MIEKAKERKTLGILAIVFGGIAFIVGLVPTVGWLGVFVGIVGIVLAIVSIFYNNKRKRLLTWIGLGVSIFSLFSSLLFQSVYLFAHAVTNSSAWSSSYSSDDDDDDYSDDDDDDYSTDDYDFTSDISYLGWGKTATLSNGVKMTISNVRDAKVGEYDDAPADGKRYIVFDVKFENTGDRSFDYDSLDFRLDVDGNTTYIKDPYLDDDEDATGKTFTELDMGTLKPGASVSGSVVATVPDSGNVSIVFVNGIGKTITTTPLYGSSI
jgi:hypothetical protein